MQTAAKPEDRINTHGGEATQGSRPMKVLLVAEHASARFGGEALIPYQYFKHMRAAGIDAHLLVHDRTKSELLQAFPQEHHRLHFVADSKVNVRLDELGRHLPSRLADFTTGAVSHFDTQWRQRRAALTLVKEKGFGLVHEPIPVSPRLPSLMTGLPVPLVIGPMNGGMDYPPAFDNSGKLESTILRSLRQSAGLMNGLLGAKRQAALLLVANARTFNALPTVLRQKRVSELVENGVDVELFRPRQSQSTSQELKITYAGRLIDVKRVDLLIAAVGRLQGVVQSHLQIIGDGPLRQQLEQQVGALGLAAVVEFTGRLPQERAAELLREADVFVLPSMRECGGAVVLEAMASGLPVVATDWGGPQDYVTPECGILIPPLSHEGFVGGLANAMIWLARNTPERLKMGLAGRSRAEQYFSWKQKVAALTKIYNEVLGAAERGNRPERPT